MNKQPIVLFRVVTSLIFIFDGVTNLAGAGKVFKKVTTSALYAYLGNDLLFMVAIYVAGGIMLGAGIFLMSGYRQRKAALLLLGVLIPITLTVQLETLNDLGAFFKNVAISGSLLFLSITNKMKTKSIVLTIAVLLGSLVSSAQAGTTSRKDNLVFLLRQKEHITQAIKTIEDLKGGSQSALNVGDVVIIVCGEAVTSLTCFESTEWIKRIQKYPGVSLEACGLSLEKFGQSEKDLVPGIGYTRNGFIKAFELQKQGYLSVEL